MKFTVGYIFTDARNERKESTSKQKRFSFVWETTAVANLKETRKHEKMYSSCRILTGA